MSDLIERYGYERAVRELKAMDDRAIWMISGCLKYREEVRKECLEYRREHNIYEVGDDVVFCDFRKGVSQKWLGETFKVIHVYEDEDVAAVSSSGVDTHLTLYTIKHATDEEIEVGRRL